MNIEHLYDPVGDVLADSISRELRVRLTDLAGYEEKASAARVRPVIQRPCWSGRAGRVDGIERRRRGVRIVEVVERGDREAQQAISLEVPGGDSGRR